MSVCECVCVWEYLSSFVNDDKHCSINIIIITTFHYMTTVICDSFISYIH